VIGVADDAHPIEAFLGRRLNLPSLCLAASARSRRLRRGCGLSAAACCRPATIAARCLCSSGKHGYAEQDAAQPDASNSCHRHWLPRVIDLPAQLTLRALFTRIIRKPFSRINENSERLGDALAPILSGHAARAARD
jgi:hypothetical protein